MNEPKFGRLIFMADMFYLDDEIEFASRGVWCADGEWVSFDDCFYATKKAIAYAKDENIDLIEAIQKIDAHADWQLGQYMANECKQ